ncbi:MAG: TonB-dependent siderophore receptor [Nostoc sp.]|uniref:TonB-dependent siderophore receptor n=1 Tax=Nostoc sp. TaxID=1180 RepID=UPI002FFAE301
MFIAPTLSWQISPRTKIRFNAEYNRYKSIYDYGLIPEPESLLVPISRFIGEPDYGDIKFDSYRVGYLLEHQFSDSWKFRNGFTAIVNDSRTPTIFGFGLNEDRRTIDRSTNNRNNFYASYSLQNEIVGKFKTGSVEHQLLLGAEIFRDSRTDDYFDNESTIASIDLFNPVYGARAENTGGEIYSRSYVDDALGFYVQDQVTLTNNLKLLLGGRFDLTRLTAQDTEGRNDEATASAFSPRAGIVYQPIEPVSLYFSYATSFFSQLDADAQGNPFDPERGRQFEVGIKADLIPNQLSTTVAAYQIKKQNVLVSDLQNPDFSIQTGEQTSQGIEFDLVGRPLDGWNIALSYAYIDAFVSKDTDPTLVDQRLVAIPKHQFGLWTSYELQRGSLKGLGVGLGLYYTSETEGQLPNTALQIPSYFRVDASAFYKRDNWKVQLNVKNLTNIEYYRSSGYWIVPQEPLTVLGSISFEF